MLWFIITVALFVGSLVSLILGLIFDVELILFGIGLAILDFLLVAFIKFIQEEESRGS